MQNMVSFLLVTIGNWRMDLRRLFRKFLWELLLYYEHNGYGA